MTPQHSQAVDEFLPGLAFR